jgi:hypothetical protein
MNNEKFKLKGQKSRGKIFSASINSSFQIVK